MANITITQTINNMTFRERGSSIEGRFSYKGLRKSVYGKSKAECKNKARDYITMIENGECTAKTRDTLEEYMEYWLENVAKISKEPSSYSKQVSVYKCQIKGTVLGRKKLSDITTSDIQEFINSFANGADHETPEQRKKRMREWTEKQEKAGIKKKLSAEEWYKLYYKEKGKVPLLLAKSGLNRIKHLIGPCLRSAVDDGLIPKNPCDKVIIPKSIYVKTKTKEQFSMSDDEIAKFKEAALIFTKHGIIRYRDAVVLLIMVATGMRIGEIIALEWNDVDFKFNRIHIHRTIQTRLVGDEKCIIKDGTKTNKERFLPMNDSIVTYLNLLKEYDSYHDIKSNYVACTTVGTMHVPRNIARSLTLLCGRAGITSNVTPHTLRHTFGSTLIRKGVGVEVVSRLMGHASIMITYEKYIHVIKEQEAKAMALTSVFD